MEATMIQVQTVPTTPYQDQKAGTSGLRKKVKVFQQEKYLENFVQSIFDSIPEAERAGKKLIVSGDGRFWNDVAISKIIKLAAGNNVGHLYIGQFGHMSTPAMSHLVRTLNKQQPDSCMGAILLTASHNPGGETEDFGIKFNTPNGGPALESLTNAVFERSKVIDKLLMVPNLPEVDISVT